MSAPRRRLQWINGGEYLCDLQCACVCVCVCVCVRACVHVYFGLYFNLYVELQLSLGKLLSYLKVAKYTYRCL